MYVTAYSTNKCESFMNSRIKFIDKRIDSSKQWEMRCQFSVLNRELPEWRTILMDQIGFTINLPQMVSQFQKNREKEYEKERQTKPEYIKYRYQQKNKKFHRRDWEIANGRYKFKDANVNKTIYKKIFRYRSCSSRYSIELSRILHEIIFHQRYPVPVEKDVIVQNLKQTKTQITRCERTLKKSIETLINRIKKKPTVRDKETLSVKNSALENLTNYQKAFYETYQLKKRTRKKKKNDQDEIEIFKEIDEEDEFDQRNSQEKGTGEELTENGFSEINKILTASDLKPSSGPKYDEMFGISFDKRLPSSFNNNNLLFEIDRNKNK
ncbi:autophagy-related protein [Anaeramoeba flamelloides]|uniref:Autophagy-related protein n=1 Tax=Anaeramoeba flamelloides TaxID=1746091 RepID=A0AAV8A692_9EUKA|nr:autophagy-related protein [Anaeramoeba flamelloides]